MNILLSICIALAVGLLSTRIMKLVKMPNVTGYLIAGIIIGPCVFGLISHEQLSGVFKVITDVALAFIAFSIGVEFKLSHFKQIGKSVLIITIAQAITTAILVDIVLITLALTTEFVSLPVAICLGAIATATAPAATLMVVRQYKAKGPVTDTLLPVVAFDDAIGLMVFSVSLAIAKVFENGSAITVQAILLEPLLEIVLSLAIGGAIGFILGLSMKLFKSRSNRLVGCITAIIAGCGLTLIPGLHLSSLLVCMMIGAVYCNMFPDNEKIMDLCDRWTAPLFMLFFVISGAELDIFNIVNVGIVGIIYIVVRSIGKITGAMWGAGVVKAEPNIRKFLGFTLLPQAGVAIGMAALCNNAMPGTTAAQITTVVLCATLIYELVGPVVTKLALSKAGEIKKTPKPQKAQGQV